MSKDLSGITYFDYFFTGGTLMCALEYEAPEFGAWEDGVQMEPNYPASMTLHNAYIDGTDVVDILAESVVQDIENKALERF